MMANVVVIGGSGFIGSHVVDVMMEAGHAVKVIDRTVRPHRRDVDFADVDLRDLAGLTAATRGADHVFHLGAVSNVNVAYRDPVHCVQVNILGTAHVLEAARQNGATRVHLASTVWVYNSTSAKEPLDEDTSFIADGAGHIYSSTKLAAEMLCPNYFEHYGLPYTVLRYGIPYGPRMREELLLPVFIKKALASEPLTVSGTGSQYRRFVYVRDLANAHLLAMRDVAANQTYNLEGRRKVTVLEVAEGIRALLGEQVQIEFTPERPGDFAGRIVSAEKAARELGWQPTVDFENGLAATVKWFCEKWGQPLRARAAMSEWRVPAV